MATPAHCLYCFEVLTAALHKNKPPSLEEVETLWEDYNVDEGSEEHGLNVQDIETEAGAQDEVEDGTEDHTISGTSVGKRKATESHGGRDLAEGLARKRNGGAREQKNTSVPLSRLLNVPSSSSGSSSASTRNNSTPSLQSSSSSRSTPISLPSNRTSATDLTLEDAMRPRLGSSAVFVTWNTVTRDGSKQLRGCIGTFDALPLEKGLKTYATAAAFEDVRFAQISDNELPSLSCAVTFLTDFETAASPLAWTIGIHGLRISFTDRHRKYGATYLPNVAPDQGWTKIETMVSLMRKAGWSGRNSEWQRVGDLKVVRYQGKKVSVDWDHWRDWRAWTEDVEAL